MSELIVGPGSRCQAKRQSSQNADFRSAASGFFQTVGDEWQRVKAGAGSVEDGIADGRGDGHNGRFASTRRSDIFSVEEDRFDFGDVAETRNAIARETRIGDAAVFELNGFEERASESLDVCADDLIAQAVGINDGAALKGGDQTHDADRA